MTSAPLLEAQNVEIAFHTRGRRGAGGHVVRAVDDVSLAVAPGEILGLVGESGSGKTTLGQALVGLQRPDRGQVRFGGTDVHGLRGDASKKLRRQMQVVFQESRGSLNGRMRVEDIIGEGLQIQGMGNRQARRRRVREVAQQVGLGSVDLSRYPHQFSGGQRQRIGIARALAVEPKFLVADEPVAALDVSVQAQVLNLLLDLRADLGLTYVLISHDLAVVERVSDRIAVMYMGRIMEHGPVGDVYAHPQVPYTYALLSARPTVPGQERYSRVILPGDIGTPGTERQGCPFAARCWMAADACRETAPELRETRPGHFAACHFAGQVDAGDPAAGQRPARPAP
jgi:peptide/nickel transport system ATP-binding protein/oligopeptide transport system ATP-binding protein